MANIYLGKKFIDTTLENVDTKAEMSSKATAKYLLRAAMAGGIVIFGYLIYLALQSNFSNVAIEIGTKTGSIDFSVLGKFLAACFFSLCLVSIYFTKSELLTSNMMMLSVAKYNKRITSIKMIKILFLCFLGNLIGGVVIGGLVSASTIINSGMYEQMAHVVEIKEAYISNGQILDLVIRAIFCNFFINISMLMVYSGNIKDDMVKVIAMFFGVFIFMYLGLEHSVANAVLFIMALFYDIFHQASTVDIWLAVQNIFWVLIGNMIGGGLLIGVVYSFINDSSKAK